MENEDENIPRKKDFLSKNFQPSKKRREIDDFGENVDRNGEKFNKEVGDVTINNAQIMEEEIPELDFEDIPIEAAVHSDPPDMMDIPLQAAVHREPDRISMPISMPLQAAVHSEPVKIGNKIEQISRIGNIRGVISKNEDTLQKDDNLYQINLDQIQKVVNILSNSKSLLIFSGAGISAPSVTFPKVEPLNNNVKNAIRNRNYYEILKTDDGNLFRDSYLFGSILPILESKPNKGHFAITDLQKLLEIIGVEVTIITQNLDNLHDLADPESNIIHIHGTLKEGICSNCQKTFDYLSLLKKFKKKPKMYDIFKCDCSGVISPNMIEYGEPVRDYDLCESKARNSDVILVIGTSLRVTPASKLVDIVEKRGGKVILFNRSDTPKDNLASLHIRGDLSEILPKILKELKKHLQNNDIIPKSIRKKIKKFKI